jgi:hypothetical protein
LKDLRAQNLKLSPTWQTPYQPVLVCGTLYLFLLAVTKKRLKVAKLPEDLQLSLQYS